jgi:perosamine synthetase
MNEPRGCETIAVRRWPSLDDEHRSAVARVLDRGVLSGAAAPEVAELEREFADFVGTGHAVGTASGTAALVLAFLALRERSDPHRDEVVVPAYTFGATACAAVLAGLRPRFVEIDPRTWGIDVRDLDRIDPGPVMAVAPVHLHGLPCDLDGVLDWAGAHGARVVEDCAQAHGATYRGRQVGSFGDFGCFSLQSSKHLGAGEGGILTTSDPGLAGAVRSLCSFGFDPGGDSDGGSDGQPGLIAGERRREGRSVFREHVRQGGMHRLQEVPASIARAQLARLGADIERVRAAAAELLARVGQLPGMVVPQTPSDRSHVFHKIRIALDVQSLAPGADPGELRDALRARLHAEGLETTLWQVPILPLHKAFAPYAEDHDWAGSRSQAAVEGSFVLFDENRPLLAQGPGFAGVAADAFERAYAAFAEEDLPSVSVA